MMTEMPNIWWEPSWEDFEEADMDLEAMESLELEGILIDPELPFN